MLKILNIQRGRIAKAWAFSLFVLVFATLNVIAPPIGNARNNITYSGGGNGFGQLGNGTTIDSSVPVHVTGLTFHLIKHQQQFT